MQAAFSHEWINESMNQSTNQSNNQSTNPSISLHLLSLGLIRGVNRQQLGSLGVSLECLPASRHMLLHFSAETAFRQEGTAPAHHMTHACALQTSRRGGVGDLAEELLF